MKKHLLLALRTAVAVAGIAFIVANVDLDDRVQAPAGTRLPDGQELLQDRAWKVVSGTYDPTDPTSELVVAVDAQQDSSRLIRIPAREIQTEGPGWRYVPGLFSMLRGANTVQLVLGLLVVGVLYPIQTLRWSLLLRARKLSVTTWKTFRLTMVGHFFNFCMPGTTGGDVVKAYYAAKGSGRRAETVVTVVVDRLCGLLGLLVLAGCAGLFMLHDPLARRLTLLVWLIGLGIAVAAQAYFSKTLRRVLGVDRLLATRPAQRFLAPIDQATMAYRNHTGSIISAIILSVVVHSVLVSATVLAGYALGLSTPIGLLLVVLPITFLSGAIPIGPPQGIGVMEFFAVIMLTPPLAHPNQVFGMLIMIRLYQMFYGVLGSAFLLKGDIHLHPQEPSNSAGQKAAAAMQR